MNSAVGLLQKSGNTFKRGKNFYNQHGNTFSTFMGLLGPKQAGGRRKTRRLVAHAAPHRLRRRGGGMLNTLKGITNQIPVVGGIAGKFINQGKRMQNTFQSRLGVVNALPYKPAAMEAAVKPYRALNAALKQGNALANAKFGPQAGGRRSRRRN